jgi:hypothetical protein
MRKTKILLSIVVLAGAFFYLRFSLKEQSGEGKVNHVHFKPPYQRSQVKEPLPETLPKVAQPSSVQAEAAKQDRRPASSEDERASLSNMTNTLERFIRPQASISDLINHLRRSRQNPLATHNSNPYTGEMAIVRTERPLPGTRYFHAQYFKGDDGSGFVQHMSFEFQPGPNSMAEAIASVRKSFSLNEPNITKNDYVQWHLDKGYILWVKKMAADDLKNDPFNAYTLADVGTIRVAVELEIH